MINRTNHDERPCAHFGHAEPPDPFADRVRADSLRNRWPIGMRRWTAGWRGPRISSPTSRSSWIWPARSAIAAFPEGISRPLERSGAPPYPRHGRGRRQPTPGRPAPSARPSRAGVARQTPSAAAEAPAESKPRSGRATGAPRNAASSRNLIIDAHRALGAIDHPISRATSPSSGASRRAPKSLPAARCMFTARSRAASSPASPA